MLIVDVETYGTDPKNGKLLGVAIASMDGSSSRYVALQSFDYIKSTWRVESDYEQVLEALRVELGRCQLVGHNYSYDKSWLDHCLGINTTWHACTRLMWHMASAPSGPRGYGLKDAQVELLGYASRGSDELEEQVRARGGSIKNGDHYLADLDVMAKYARLDVESTGKLYSHLKPFFDKHDYWWLLEKMVKYSWLLQQNTKAGVKADVPKLEEYIEILKDTKAAYSAQFIELTETHINRLERTWKEHRAAAYTSAYARQAFLSDWGRQPRFKLSSDPNKRELFYKELKLPVVMKTDGGLPSTGLSEIKVSIHSSGRYTELAELLEAYEEAESADALLSGFAKPWHGSIVNGRLHPRFNPCGTVTYRLSGFKPYLLNAPASEYGLMSCLGCDEGWEGVHADFTSVEPCVTAHFSQDPNLLKVFRDGKGDVYLDLALTLFPDNQELKEGYNPNEKVTSEIKNRFKSQRDIAKIIQLAVQYTGTWYTVKNNLMNTNIYINRQQATAFVQAYWKHFRRVAVMNETFFRLFERDGLVRNVIGRIIRVPTHISTKKRDGTLWEKPLGRYKDLPNRVIQSSGHDLLSLYVLNIADLISSRRITAKPVIIDWHDATDWQCPKEQIKDLEAVYRDALTMLNDEVRMSVPVKIEMKRFKTLAGLKGEEL